MSDLIPVRADETFDVDSFVAWAQTSDLVPHDRPSIQQFAGGKANLTYLLTYQNDAEMVLRRPPLGPVAKSSHDMGREFAVLSKLWVSFDKAPRAFAYCDDPDVIGSPFFIMERKPGVVVRQVVPDVFGAGADESANRALSEVVIGTLAEFHSVDPAECGLDDLGRPDGFLERQVLGWSDRWQKARHQESPLADELSDWLSANVPASPKVTLLHNDWRLDNMAVSPTDPGRCEAVYDWDMATRGDPLADLGTLMATWFHPGEAPDELSMMPTTSPGWLGRSEACAMYGRLTGSDLSDLNWYLTFGAWKLAVVLQQIFIRWHRGQTQDSRFAHLDQGAQLLLELAADRRVLDGP